VQGRNLLGRQLARTTAVRAAAQRLRAAENAHPAPPAQASAVAHVPAALHVPAPLRAPIAAAPQAQHSEDARAQISAEWHALSSVPALGYTLFTQLLGADPLAQRAVPRPDDASLAAAILRLVPSAPTNYLATLRANGGLAQFVATLTGPAHLGRVVSPALRASLTRDVAAFLRDPKDWLRGEQRREQGSYYTPVWPDAAPPEQAAEFFTVRILPHLHALQDVAAGSAAVDAAYRASGMLSLRALGAVDHAAGARVRAVGQFEVGVVAVVQRGPNWWDLVVGGAVHTFEDAAGALAAQGLNALIAVGGPGVQQLARAAGQDLGQILANPGAFFAHLATALGEGFGLFAGDLGGNLERGALAWLSGQGGLTLPALDAAGLLTFALETAGVSYAAFTGDLQTAFTRHHRDGARLVAGLDTLYPYVTKLQDLAAGPGGRGRSWRRWRGT